MLTKLWTMLKQNKFMFDEVKKNIAGQVLIQFKKCSLTKQKQDLEWTKVGSRENKFKKIKKI